MQHKRSRLNIALHDDGSGVTIQTSDGPIHVDVREVCGLHKVRLGITAKSSVKILRDKIADPELVERARAVGIVEGE